MQPITIIDSVMGAGKTRWATQYAREHQDINILFVSPFLTELDDFIDETKIDGIETFVQPKQRQKEKRKRRKLDDIINLIESEKNICCTHELFIAFDERCRTALKNNNYILIIDEAIECVQMFYQDSPADIKTLIEDGRLQIINDELKPTDQSYKDKNNSRYYCIQAAQERRLFVIDNKCYIWVYSPDIWQIFDKVYVLTYLFEGCTLKYYYDFYEIPYKKVSVILSNDRYQLIQHYEPSKSKLKNLTPIAIPTCNFSQRINNSWYNQCL